MIQPGKYEAKITDYGVKETKAGQPAVIIAFDVAGNSVYWTGYFTERTMEQTKATLLMLGLKNGYLPGLALGLSGNALNATKSYSITVVHEADQDGKMWPRVRWVNDPTASNIKSAVSVEKAKQLFAGITFEVAREEPIPF